jgi:hypothetical protein
MEFSIDAFCYVLCRRPPIVTADCVDHDSLNVNCGGARRLVIRADPATRDLIPWDSLTATVASIPVQAAIYHVAQGFNVSIL